MTNYIIEDEEVFHLLLRPRARTKISQSVNKKEQRSIIDISGVKLLVTLKDIDGDMEYIISRYKDDEVSETLHTKLRLDTSSLVTVLELIDLETGYVTTKTYVVADNAFRENYSGGFISYDSALGKYLKEYYIEEDHKRASTVIFEGSLAVKIKSLNKLS